MWCVLVCLTHLRKKTPRSDFETSFKWNNCITSCFTLFLREQHQELSHPHLWPGAQESKLSFLHALHDILLLLKSRKFWQVPPSPSTSELESLFGLFNTCSHWVAGIRIKIIQAITAYALITLEHWLIYEVFGICSCVILRDFWLIWGYHCIFSCLPCENSDKFGVYSGMIHAGPVDASDTLPLFYSQRLIAW